MANTKKKKPIGAGAASRSEQQRRLRTIQRRIQEEGRNKHNGRGPATTEAQELATLVGRGRLSLTNARAINNDRKESERRAAARKAGKRR